LKLHPCFIHAPGARNADGKPTRAFQGDDYQQHLCYLLANQTSPSAVEQQLRQHLRELLDKQMASPTGDDYVGEVAGQGYQALGW